jgi:hypothetical protein
MVHNNPQSLSVFWLQASSLCYGRDPAPFYKPYLDMPLMLMIGMLDFWLLDGTHE